MTVDFVFLFVCFIETLSLISQTLLILMLYQDRIASRGSKAFLNNELLARTRWPYTELGRKQTFSVLLSFAQDWKRWERKFCRLRKGVVLCVTFKLEFKADYVKKNWKLSPINKMLSHCGGDRKGRNKTKTNQPKWTKKLRISYYFFICSCFQWQNHFHLMAGIIMKCILWFWPLTQSSVTEGSVMTICC